MRCDASERVTYDAAPEARDVERQRVSQPGGHGDDGQHRHTTGDAARRISSFAHVLRLEPDIMKIDISVTRGIDRDPARRGLAKGIVSVARDTGATIVAEVVETQAELDTLFNIGVDAGQGFSSPDPHHCRSSPNFPGPRPDLPAA